MDVEEEKQVALKLMLYFDDHVMKPKSMLSFEEEFDTRLKSKSFQYLSFRLLFFFTNAGCVDRRGLYKDSQSAESTLERNMLFFKKNLLVKVEYVATDKRGGSLALFKPGDNWEKRKDFIRETLSELNAGQQEFAGEKDE